MKEERRHTPKVGKREREGLVTRKAISYEDPTPEEAAELCDLDDFDRLAGSIQEWARRALEEAGLPSEEGRYVISEGGKWESIPQTHTDLEALERAQEAGGKLTRLQGAVEALSEELSPPWCAAQSLHWLAEAENPEIPPRYAAVAGMRAMHYMHTGMFRQRYEQSALVGQDQLAAGQAGKEESQAEASSRRLDWQSRANEVWARNSHLSKKEVARRIAQPGERPDTIRRRITPPERT